MSELTWDFYRRLKDIIPNLPMQEVTKFRIEGRVNECVRMHIEMFTTGDEGKQILNENKGGLVKSNKVYALVDITEQYNNGDL